MRHTHTFTVVACGFVLLLAFSCGKGRDADETAETPSGTTIVESGELAAINSRAFTLPRYGRYWNEMRIVGLLEHGTEVTPGDSIIQLDDTDIKKFIIDRETELETELASREKQLVDQQNNQSEMESRIKSEIASFQLKTIELESSRFESERHRRIKALEFEQAKITLAKEKRRQELHKIMDENDRKIQEIKVRQLKIEIENAYNILPQLTIRTPISGVFQVARSGEFMKIGDLKYPGNPLGSVPELTRMKVETFIQETDFLKIYEGQPVTVRLDAMPRVPFNGVVMYIGKLCRPRERNSRQKGFDVVVELTDNDERLKPGMTASCEFLELR